MDRTARIVAGEGKDMTPEDILRMARELYGTGATEQEIRFAALVAAAEREACADICDQHASIEGIAQRCAAEIRARSKP
jgi:hypothetical protein